MSYKKRYADIELKRKLKNTGAVLITGPKGCGKTETALQIAKSSVQLDLDENARIETELNPSKTLEGKTPRLIDEWQEFPILWNHVRRAVDNRKKTSQFILTGSANPEERIKLHSGAGRVSTLKMRPMSLFERDWSTGEVPLSSILEGKKIESNAVKTTIDNLSEMLLFGGWPSLINKPLKSAKEFISGYITLTSEVDLSRVSNKKRDPIKVKRLLQSLSRNIATEVTIAGLANDVRGNNFAFKEETASDYLDALERLMVVENLPSWSAHLRSSATLRKAAKRHFTDPSLACGALGLTMDKLLKDIKFLGLLFESLVIRDLRIYAQVNDAEVYHYRDSSGREVDVIIETNSGEWIAIEIKLGISAVDEAARKLKDFEKLIDGTKMKKPSALAVITGNGFAHVRKDGVFVIPITALRA